ncbi:Ctr copper transporter family protein [Toxoplasma gondii TgCatPRC2]|uniref:Copper transport protein n=13 Tax=Toxoplasma gondii TaxID=5811 RepID=S7W925_TOXGG|nr:Ctr copper transporter family protein [Toxoplasma gondii GT1]KAF4638686.1 Ctr copper transporter family protein [Toxoplasma gondii]KFG46363.1 Ctr copper transporter family protein [Toxoplasma gondii GAB2-2007-GAL-DOM2]KFG48697.1 Ctr copper transporter family protein [Toxoplasma gondii p89]KFG54189.1 Ctr copper transporter family protein [Toxoplasma gondii FOU]KFG64325.1 Ctr copper transporter family protein [Toxoplasma gondii RUB]KFH10681.1 Ctr copper transporter family protein [Toxoplasma
MTISASSTARGCAAPPLHAETVARSPPSVKPATWLPPSSLFQGRWTKFLLAASALFAVTTQPVLGRLSIDGMPLPMAFEVSTRVIYLFEDWPTETTTQFAGACVATCILGFICVILKVVRRYVEKSLVSQENAGKTKLIFGSFPLYSNSVRFLVAFVNYSWDYMLMLLSMTFNVGIFLSLLLGIALGFLFLGDLMSVEVGSTKKPWKPCQCPNHPCYTQQETGEGTTAQACMSPA